VNVGPDLAILFVRGSGEACTHSTLRSWVHRGHIRRYRSGYSLVEIAAYLVKRQAIDGTRGTCNAHERITLR
jgi:hypothetical protein